MINFLKGKRGKYEEDYAEKVIYLLFKIMVINLFKYHILARIHRFLAITTAHLIVSNSTMIGILCLLVVI
jgi:hypothetical protein